MEYCYEISPQSAVKLAINKKIPTFAVTIDLKSFSEEFYRKVNSAELQPVLRAMRIIKQNGVWLEIVSLVIPTLNDNPKDIEKICLWIKENLFTVLSNNIINYKW